MKTFFNYFLIALTFIGLIWCANDAVEDIHSRFYGGFGRYNIVRAVAGCYDSGQTLKACFKEVSETR